MRFSLIHIHFMRAIFRNILTISLCLFFGVAVAFAEGGKHRFTLVIDAGHGGHDAGALGAYSKEKDINLTVALAFGRLVEENCPDVKVVYTRKRDVFIPLQRRADIANDNKADLFISIHTNALPNGKQAYGSETYSLGMARANENLAVAKRENGVITLENDYQRTYQGFDPNKAESYVIFEIMQDKYMRQSVDLARCIQNQYTQAGRPNKGVHQAGFLVLRNTSMPSVLTELGFITTPSEESYLNSQKGVAELSRSIYNGFLTYRRQHDKTARDLPASLPARVGEKGQQPGLQAGSDTEVAVVPVATVPTQRLVAAREEEQSKQPERSVREVTRRDNAATVRPTAGQQVSRQTRETKSKQSETAPKAAAKNTQAKAKTPAAKESKAKQQVKQKPKVNYRVQVGAGKKEISPKDSQFKGLAIQRVKEGSLYKYFYGNYTSFAEAQKGLKTAKAKIPGAYIVAYVAGKSVSVSEARAKEKEKTKTH